ncbi:MAG: hypothetical protein GY720_14755, partial [bacterium]|nr:hypothetical protein [bacterium]
NAVMDRLGGHPSNLIDSYDYYRPLFIGNPHVWRCASWLGYPASYMVEEFPFLNGDLEPGDETSLELSAGIYLHFRVLEERRTITPAAAFNNALRIFYYFEHPVTAFYDIYDPEPIGYLRSLDYGTIDWVAGVGPVHSTYRAMVLVGPTIDEGMGMTSAVLTDATNLTSE